MRFTYNNNYKGRSKAPRGGHRKGLIYQTTSDPNISNVRSMPEHYHDADSPAQQPCRNRHREVMKMWNIIKDQIKGCFEGPRSDYIKYLHYNMLIKDGRFMVSHGSLPSNDDWQPGDELRRIKTPDGQYALVHMRKAGSSYLCSTEYLKNIAKLL